MKEKLITFTLIAVGFFCYVLFFIPMRQEYRRNIFFKCCHLSLKAGAQSSQRTTTDTKHYVRRVLCSVLLFSL